ncbi:WhiB family transcriptional regulator [Corynebacterium felinum]|uniref:Transcriptional regulator WhiB n=1 Tax=Corynebacterium felinum TaxID=131318 RepID=A0ABU2B7W8_9CORY|nr:WhiB family transcriptional regulator [Corynebacterium felinum]MDF5820540.1 WhiB family transcriptional regulator [Corynebacterium felinum]MDR7354119.1 WhiB family redox-sensing transcriptional regulator [Corynebacterium felinum]WJY96291.1 Transcriptional regulator WhiB4 [Corynebacterium felinum]
MTSSLADKTRNPFVNATDLSDFTSSLERGDWVTQANCRNGDPDALFVRGAAQRRAAVICRQCPVLMHCRADALDNRVEFGVWGGLTERQRRALLRKNPHIQSWAEYLANGGELVGI